MVSAITWILHLKTTPDLQVILPNVPFGSENRITVVNARCDQAGMTIDLAEYRSRTVLLGVALLGPFASLLLSL